MLNRKISKCLLSFFFFFVVVVLLFLLGEEVSGFQPPNQSSRVFPNNLMEDSLVAKNPFVTTSSTNPMIVPKKTSQTSLFYQDNEEWQQEPSPPDVLFSDRQTIDKVNKVLKAFRNSFKNVESLTDTLLEEQPLFALTIFVSLGLLSAYLLGYFFLDGYIETWNPAQNDAIPYWDDEILIIQRKIGR